VAEQSDRTRGLIPFQPGQSGNPSGRPKKRPLTEALLCELAKPHGRQGRTKREAMMARLVSIALTAKPREAIDAFKLALAYTDGLPVQTIELDVLDVARREAEARGLDPDKVVSLFEAARARRTG
jgi:hypothetical protein